MTWKSAQNQRRSEQRDNDEAAKTTHIGAAYKLGSPVENTASTGLLHFSAPARPPGLQEITITRFYSGHRNLRWLTASTTCNWSHHPSTTQLTARRLWPKQRVPLLRGKMRCRHQSKGLDCIMKGLFRMQVGPFGMGDGPLSLKPWLILTVRRHLSHWPRVPFLSAGAFMPVVMPSCLQAG